ncbi:hypothetical protein Dimus_037431 [Dionaea muscipula]
MIPFSQWTPLVVGLSSDASESSSETSDLGNSFPIETLEEEIESSNGDSAASESSSDDEEAERHDVVADGANVSEKQTSISGIQHPPEILGFPEHHLHPDSGGALPFEKSQVNPNPSISPMNLCSEVDLCSSEQDNAMELSLNHASLQESPCPRGFAPSTSLQTPLNPDNGNPDNDDDEEGLEEASSHSDDVAEHARVRMTRTQMILSDDVVISEEGGRRDSLTFTTETRFTIGNSIACQRLEIGDHRRWPGRIRLLTIWDCPLKSGIPRQPDLVRNLQLPSDLLLLCLDPLRETIICPIIFERVTPEF